LQRDYYKINNFSHSFNNNYNQFEDNEKNMIT